MKPPRVAIYARVSTSTQKVDIQLDELRRIAEQRAWDVVGEYIDQGESGSKDRRPQLDEMMKRIHRGGVDLVAVWKIDRLGRSLRHLVDLFEIFRVKGVDFLSSRDSVDTSTAAGRLMFQIVGAFAEFEREIIRERVIAGVAAARRRGSRLGRPKVKVDLDRARELRAGGASFQTVATALGLSVGTVYAALQQSPPKSPSDEA